MTHNNNYHRSRRVCGHFRLWPWPLPSQTGVDFRSWSHRVGFRHVFLDLSLSGV